ncbi:MAG: hypothetical protein ACR2O6_01350 [Ilumatobacteraceae bacterium]
MIPAIVKRRLLFKATLGGGPVVHVLAFAVQPMAYLRRLSMRRGILGSSRGWRYVAIFAFMPGLAQKIFGRGPEQIAVETVRPPQFISVLTATPLTRKQQKRTGITRKRLERRAQADVAAAKGVEPD